VCPQLVRTPTEGKPPKSTAIIQRTIKLPRVKGMETTISGSGSPGKILLKKALLICGILSSLLYASIDALAGTLYVGYSHISQAFSELLSLGSPVRQLALQLAALYGVLLLAFALGVWMSADRSRALRVTALMVFGQAVDGLVTPVYFPAPMRGVAGAESAGILHAILTAVGVFTILLAVAFGAVAYRNWFRYYSVGSLLVILAFGLIGFSYIPAITANMPTPWLGATERVNIYGWMLWVTVLAIILLKIEKGPASTRMQANQGESK